MKIYKILAVAALLILNNFFSYAFAQQDNSVILDNINENITINTDRDLYFSGEKIFFSINYNLNNSKELPLLSNVIYLELISCGNGISHIQKKYSLSGYNANGVLFIPQEIETGNYMLRAYTKYQRNFSDLNFSYQFLTIINPKSKSESFSSWQNTDSIWIVPESNILLDNIKNKLIIRVPDSLQTTENRFFIKDNQNQIVETFTFSESGFTQVELTCNYINNYYFVVENNSGVLISKPLPKVVNSGIQTNINRIGNSINFIIQTKGNNQALNPNYKVKVFSNDYRPKFSKDVSLSNSTIYVDINMSVFEEGINYIILQNPDGGIERINSYYNGLKEVNKIEIDISKVNFSTRESIRATITSPAINSDFPTVAVSVIKKGANLNRGAFKPSFHLNHSLLIENYFNSNNVSDKQFVSQVLALFDAAIDKNEFLKSINSNKATNLEYYPELRGLTISGILQNKITKEPVGNHDVYLSVLYNNPQLHIYKTLENGEFVFSLTGVTGINDIFICPVTDIKDEYEIRIKNSFYTDAPIYLNIPSIISYRAKKHVEDMYVNTQLQQRFCKTEDSLTRNRVRSSQFNIDESKSTFYLKNYIKFESIEEIFTEIITNAKISKSGDQIKFSVYDKNSFILPGKPLVLVDYLPIFDYSTIMNLHISQIEKIEVIDKSYVLGSNIINGVILITTNTDNFGEIGFPNSSIFVEYQTLEKPKTYSVIIAACEPKSHNQPDFRTTLYWNPKLKIKQAGETIEFTASDSKGLFEIIVKGTTPDGDVYFGKKEFMVE